MPLASQYGFVVLQGIQWLRSDVSKRQNFISFDLKEHELALAWLWHPIRLISNKAGVAASAAH